MRNFRFYAWKWKIEFSAAIDASSSPPSFLSIGSVSNNCVFFWLKMINRLISLDSNVQWAIRLIQFQKIAKFSLFRHNLFEKKNQNKKYVVKMTSITRLNTDDNLVMSNEVIFSLRTPFWRIWPIDGVKKSTVCYLGCYMKFTPVAIFKF